MPDLCLTQAEYSFHNNSPVINIFGRDSSGVSHRVDVVGFKPYFFVPASESPKATPPSEVDSNEYFSILHEPLVKVITQKPGDIFESREKFSKHYEADILYTLRFLIDTKIKSGFSYTQSPCTIDDILFKDLNYPARVCIVDIECSDERGFPDATKDPIFCITCHDSFTNRYITFVVATSPLIETPKENGCFDPAHHDVITYTDEKSLLVDFCEYIKSTDPDIITGWNCVPEDTMVDTKNGLIPIKALIPGIVLNTGGKVVSVYNTGVKNTTRIRTSIGWDFIVGEDHRMLVSQIPQDRHYVWEHCENYEPTYEISKNITSDSILHIPIRQYENNIGLGLDPFNCYRAGLIYSDGARPDKWRFRFYNKNINLINRCCGENHRWFTKGVWCSNILQRDLKGAEHLILVGDKKQLNFGLLSRLSVEEFGAFLAGWYDGDGYSDVFCIGDHTINIRHFQLFAGFGAITSSTCNINLRILCITQKLLECMKKFLQKKIKNKIHIIKRKRVTRKDHFRFNFNRNLTNMYLRVKNVSNDVPKNCYDIETTEHNFSIGCVVHNCNEFDIPYILGRMDVLGIPRDAWSRLPSGNTGRIEIKGRQLFDLLSGYKRMHLGEQPSYRLDAIALEELGKQKIHHNGKVFDLWKEDPTNLVYYNFTDVELCVGINAKDETVEFHRYVAHYAGCPLEKTTNSMPIIDMLVLREAKENGFILPSKANSINTQESFEGATVIAPMRGVQENVAVLDAKSLYPMSMMTINASPETKDPKGELRAPNGVRFKKEPDGLVRKIQAKFLRERDEMKKERNKYPFDSREYKLLNMKQDVVKVCMNSYYGVSANPMFRLNDRDVGSAITSVGRALLEHNKKLVEHEEYKIVFGDTDSVGIKIPKSIGKEGTMFIAKELETLLNNSYPQFAKETLNADVQYFSVKFEKLYQRFFSGGKKKRYAGLLIWKEGVDAHKIDIVGFETKRSDSPKVTRDAMKTLIEMVLEGKPYEEIRTTISDVIRKYRAGKYSLDDVGIPGGIGKPLEEYDIQDAQVRAAVYSNTYLGTNFGKGSKPKRLYIKNVTSKYPRTDVVCFEYADQIDRNIFIVDVDTMLEKTLKTPLSRIMEPLNFNWCEFDPATPTLGKWGF